MGSITIYGIGGNIKVEVEGKIIKISTETKVDNIEEVLTRALLGDEKDIENVTNSAGTDKVITTRDLKAEFDIWLVLIAVIASGELAKNV